MSVRRVQEEVSSAEFTEWMQFEHLDPGGYERDALHFASISQTIANCNRDPKRNPVPFSIDDFVVRFDQKVSVARRQDSETIAARLREWIESHNKKFKEV